MKLRYYLRKKKRLIGGYLILSLFLLSTVTLVPLFFNPDKDEIAKDERVHNDQQDIEEYNQTLIAAGKKKPKISIYNVKCNDDRISFNYRVQRNIPSKHDGGIVEIWIVVICPSKNAWRWTSFNLWYKKDYYGSYSTNELVHTLWPIYGGWYDVAELYDWGNKDIIIEVEAVQEYWKIWPFITETANTEAESHQIIDDDDTPPDVKAYLYTTGFSEEIKSGLTYDIHEIPYSESQNWKIRIQATDSSGVQWKGFYGEGTWHTMSSYYIEMSLKSIIDEFPTSEIISFGSYFKDLDNDRPNDYSPETTFQFKLLRQKPWYAPSYEGLADVKIEGDHQRYGYIFPQIQSKTTADPFDYKKDGEKNKVKFKVHFKNNEDYPIRFKLGFSILDDRHYENVKISINEDFIYKYSNNVDDHYEGNLNPEDVFESDDEIDGVGNYYFWIEIPSGFDGEIELFTITVDSLVLVDRTWWLILQDVVDIGFLITNFAMSWHKGVALGGVVADFVQDIIFWINTYMKFQDILANKGGYLNIFFNVKEAFVPKKALDNNPYKWIWNLTRDDISTSLNAPQHYSEDYDFSRLESMIGESEFIEKDEVTRSFYARIGFIPNQHQEDALWTFLAAEIFSDVAYLLAHICTIIEPDPVVGFTVALLFLFFGIAADLAKWHWLDVANGADPPDPNYFEKPNAKKIEFPYENFPEIQSAPDTPFIQESKQFIDTFLDYEKLQTDLSISNDRYTTAINEKNYEGAKVQLDYRQEILTNISSISCDLDAQFKSVLNEFESSTNNDPLHFTEEELAIITSHDHAFSIDERMTNFVANYSDVRGVDQDFLLDNIQASENKVNSYELEDLELLNTVSPTIHNIYDYSEITSESLKKENADMNQYIMIEKLGESAASDDEISFNLNSLENQLSNLKSLVLDGEYYQSILIANEIKEKSLNLYYETLRKEFLDVYESAEGFRRYAEQTNQIKLDTTDSSKKSVKNGKKVNISINIRNIVSEAILNKYDEIQPILYIPNLPDGITYKLYHNGIELNKSSNYYIQLGQNEIKNLKLEICIEQDSPLEMSEIPITLVARQDTPEKTMYYEVNFTLHILDDDTTPPEIKVVEDPLGWTLSINDDDGAIDSIATGTYQIVDEQGTIIDSGIIEENVSYQLILPMKVGNYTLMVFATNNDNDRDGDEESLQVSATLIITLGFLYDYMINQLEELKAYIDENACWLVSRILNRKLSQVQNHLQDAYCLIERGKITCALFHDIVAKVLLRITEFRTEIFNKIHFINDEDAEYIIKSTHKIRNNIVILMGASIGTEKAYNIALIEVDLLNLNDFIEENISCWKSRCLRNCISSAARCLEWSIVKLSMNSDIECLLKKAQWKLEMAKCKVNCMLKRGKISQELADIIILKIEKAHTSIENVKNYI